MSVSVKIYSVSLRPDKDIRYDILGKNKNQERSSSYLRLLFEVELERMNQDSE